MDIEDLIKKTFKIKKKQDAEKLEKYIKDLCDLKNKVVSSIEKGWDCFCVEGYGEKLFASQFFDEIENWGCTRYDKTYKITITEKSLRKLDKELKKYNLDIY